MVSYVIRDRKILSSIIYPIFEKYPLLTSKHFFFERIKKVHSILDSNSNKEEKNRLIFSIMEQEKSILYISPA